MPRPTEHVPSPLDLPQPHRLTVALHHLLRIDAALWALFTAPWRRLRRPALRG